MRGTPPAWLVIEDGKYIVEEKFASVVSWIYRLALLGLSPRDIADKFNDPHRSWVPPLSDKKRRGGVDKVHWEEKDVHNLLTNPAVYGYSRNARTKKLRKVYPVVITKHIFEEVQRVRKGGPQGFNLFAGLLRCGKCTEPLRLRGSSAHPYLECRKGHIKERQHYGTLEPCLIECITGSFTTFDIPKRKAASESAVLSRKRHAALLRRLVNHIDVDDGGFIVVWRGGERATRYDLSLPTFPALDAVAGDCPPHDPPASC